jgi:UDP-N-acetylglucosamine/UDP-N-acetylgalactosamine 4-epimerase
VSSTQNKLTGRKILVTGGAGFIGSNLCEDLLAHGNEVTCLDNLSTGKEKNIASLRSDPRFRFIQGDIRELQTCRDAIAGQEIVLHQAALGSVPRSIDDPITTNSVNIDGFLNMLVAARDARVKRFVYAASSSTYGDSESLPKTEDRIGMPLSPYAVTKYAGELYAHVFAMHYGMEVIGLRYFNVFGRRQDPEGGYAAAIPKFTRLLIRHESPVIYGDGSTTRDFTYIDNVIQMNHLAATTSNREALGEVFNTAAGANASLNDVVNLLKENLAAFDPKIADIKVKYEPSRKGDIRHSLASITKAKKMLGYEPRFMLREGLREAVKWYWENLR